MFVAAGPSIEDRIWLTMGDFGEIWSNGYLPAAKYQVIIPRPKNGFKKTSSRYSIPYFVNPRHDGVLEPQTTGKFRPVAPGQYKKIKMQDHIESGMKYQYTDPRK